MKHAMTSLGPDDIDRLAHRRAAARMGWFIHAAVYVLVNALLYARSREAFGTAAWSVFPLLGWGIGLAMHGLVVFVLGSGSRLQRRMVERERERLQRGQESARRW